MGSLQAQLLQHSTTISKADESQQRKQNESIDDRKLISSIFVRLQSACPAWKQSIASLPADEAQAVINQIKRDWLNCFMENEINDMRLIDYAFSRLQASKSPFLPTVGQFMEWCEDGRVPAGTKTHSDSYKEITGWLMQASDRRHISDLSDSVYHTYVSMEDQQGFRQLGDRIKRMEIWRSEYKRTLDKLKEGGHIRVAPPANQMQIGNSKARPASKETMMSALEAMRKGL